MQEPQPKTWASGRMAALFGIASAGLLLVGYLILLPLAKQDTLDVKSTFAPALTFAAWFGGGIAAVAAIIAARAALLANRSRDRALAGVGLGLGCVAFAIFAFVVGIFLAIVPQMIQLRNRGNVKRGRDSISRSIVGPQYPPACPTQSANPAL